MDKLQSFLKEWGINFVKNKDTLLRNIVDIKERKDGFDFIVNFKDRKQSFIVIPFINNINEIIDKINKEDHFTLIFFNYKDNLNVLITNWKILVEYKHLCIYFVNPFSELDKKWIIYPHTHHKIGDPNSLELGLKSMFETVDPISKEDLIKRLDQNKQ